MFFIFMKILLYIYMLTQTYQKKGKKKEKKRKAGPHIIFSRKIIHTH